MAKKKTNLRYNRNTMKWVDTDGNEAIHPRYSLKPGSLDSKAFMNSYLAAVRDGQSLNDFMKTNQAYDAKKVQARARKLRKAYQELTEAAGQKDGFNLLRQVTYEDEGNQLGKDVAAALHRLGLRTGYGRSKAVLKK
jgi:hypothetical protein